MSPGVHIGAAMSAAEHEARGLLCNAAMPRLVITGLCLAGCYTGAPANRDVATAWQQRTRAEIEGRWGPPAASDRRDAASLETWTFNRVHFVLPGGSATVAVRPVTVDAAAGPVALHAQGNLLELAASVHPGAIIHSTTSAVALVDPAGVVTRVDGAALHWGPPNDVNLHWGTIFGAHVGLGRLDTASSPLPAGSAYVGGMLGPTLGLVGVFDLAAGSSDQGSAMGLGAGIAAQWWPVNRLWLRAGPAMLLTFDPGFTNAALRPGVTAGASYAIIKVGVLALDLRFELDAGSSTAFGSAGIGINVN